MLIRKKYISKIISPSKQPLIKILVGARRVGKTTLLQQVYNTYDEHTILWYSFDIFGYDHHLDDKLFWKELQSTINPQIQAICCDEIQMMPNRHMLINALYTKYPQIQIYITGSNSDMLSSELATHIAGRYMTYHVYPFSYGEYCEIKALTHGRESWMMYMQDGGLPMLIQESDYSKKRQMVEHIIDTTIMKDIMFRHQIKDVGLLYELVKYMVYTMGDTTNISNIVKYLKQKGIYTNNITIANYVSYLMHVFMIYPCSLYDVAGKNIFDTIKKYYIIDHSLRNYMFSGFDPSISKALENSIYIACISHGRSVHVGRVKDKEVDFICEKAGKRIYIQVTSYLQDEQVITREYHSLKQINDSRPKYILSLDDGPIADVDGVQHVSIWNYESILM